MPVVGTHIGVGRLLESGGATVPVARPAPVMPASDSLTLTRGEPDGTIVGVVRATNHVTAAPGYAFVELVPGLSIHSVTGTVTITDAEALVVGGIEVGVSATNVTGGAFTLVTIVIFEELQAPIMPSAVSITFSEGISDLTIVGQAQALNHNEAQPIEYAFETPVPGLSINPASGFILVSDSALISFGETSVSVSASNPAGTAFTTLTLLISALPSSDKIFYVSLDGNDLNVGNSDATAWQTIDKVNATTFEPGSVIMFRGGDVFLDQLSLVAGQHYGDAIEGPVRFTSYGSGRATHRPSSNSDNGLSAVNPEYVEISDLNFIGAGRDTSTASGISMVTTTADAVRRTGVTIRRCEITGFGNDGVVFWSDASDDSPSGIDHILLEDVDVHHCCGTGSTTGGNGIVFLSNAYGLALNEPSFYRPILRRCRVWENPGKAGMAKSSGSGILLGQCSGALIEFGETYLNGSGNTFATGPAGIRLNDCVDSIVQFCNSHDNATGVGTSDGGGIDIDAGCQRCIVQYCYSSNNSGPGLQLNQSASSGSLLPLSDNHIRFNISEDDGAEDTTNKGGVLVSSIEAVNQPYNYIYNNTIRSSRADARGVFIGTNPDRFTSSVLANNIFQLTGAGSQAIRSDTSTVPGVTCLANLYDTPSLSIKWGATTYTSMASWRAAYPTQETISSADVSISGDPLFAGPVPVGSIFGLNLSSLSAYQIGVSSLARDEGVNLETLFGIEMGLRDFFNGSLPPIGLDIGAHVSDDELVLYYTSEMSGSYSAIDGTVMGSMAVFYGNRDIEFNIVFAQTNITAPIDTVVGEIDP